MPGCVLRVFGKEFDPESFLARASLAPYSVYKAGDERFPGSRSGKTHETGGFKCDVSNADGNLAAQVQDAIAFLTNHRATLSGLRSVPSIEGKYLDFGYDCRLNQETCVAQFDYLPAELLKLCGELGLGIELSLYPAPSA